MLKTNIPNSLKTIDEAKKLLTELHNNNETFHPEDDAHDCFPEATKAECDRLNKCMNDIYNFEGQEGSLAKVFCPCQYLLDLQDIHNINKQIPIAKFVEFKRAVIALKVFSKNSVMPPTTLMNYTCKLINGETINVHFSCNKIIKDLFYKTIS